MPQHYGVGVTPAHLTNAARVLEQLLAARYPEHAFVVGVEERDRRDPASRTGTPARVDQAGAIGDHTDTLAERRARTTPPATANHDRLKKTA